MVKDAFQLSQSLFTSLLGAETEIKSLTAKISALKDGGGKKHISNMDCMLRMENKNQFYVYGL